MGCTHGSRPADILRCGGKREIKKGKSPLPAWRSAGLEAGSGRTGHGTPGAEKVNKRRVATLGPAADVTNAAAQLATVFG